MLAVIAITNKSLRALMTGFLCGIDYVMNHTSQLRPGPTGANGDPRIPSKNRYRLTEDGLPSAMFYTKPHDRLLRLLLAARPYENRCAPSRFTPLSISTRPGCSLKLKITVKVV